MSCHGRNLQTKTLFQVFLLEFSFFVLSNFSKGKNFFDLKVSTLDEMSSHYFTDFRALLSFLSPIRPENGRQLNKFCVRVLTANAESFITV